MPVDYRGTYGFLALQAQMADVQRQQAEAEKRDQADRLSAQQAVQNQFQLFRDLRQAQNDEWERSMTMAEMFGKAAGQLGEVGPTFENARVNQMSQAAFAAGQVERQKQISTEEFKRQQAEQNEALRKFIATGGWDSAEAQNAATLAARADEGKANRETQTNIAAERNKTTLQAAGIAQAGANTRQGSRFQHDIEMEGLRQDNRLEQEDFRQQGRIEMENLRHKNRVDLAAIRNNKTANGNRLTTTDRTKLNEALRNVRGLIQGLTEIGSNPEEVRNFLNARTKLEYAIGRHLERWTDIPENLSELIRQKAGFDSRIGRAFDQYRQAITGAAAADAELERLMNNFINSGMSYSQFMGALDSILADAKNKEQAWLQELNAADRPSIDGASIMQMLTAPPGGAPPVPAAPPEVKK